MIDIEHLIDLLHENAENLDNEAAVRKEAADALTRLQAENKQLVDFVIACGGFWGNSKSQLLGDDSLHAVIERAFSEAAEAEKLKAENADLRQKCDHIMTEHGKRLEEVARLREELVNARNKALDEAAMICEQWHSSPNAWTAVEIRRQKTVHLPQG